VANPQIEDGYTRIANELLEAFAMFRVAGREIQVIWAILRLTYGYGKRTAVIPLRQIAQFTGMNRVEIARLVSNLRYRNILSVTNNGDRKPLTIGINKDYSKWMAVTNIDAVTNNGNRAVTNNGDRSVTNIGDTTFKERNKALKKKRHSTSADPKNGPSDPPVQISFLTPSNPTCPHGEIITLYHVTCPSLPAVKDWTKHRQSLLRSRWNEDKERQSLEWWKSFFQKVAASDFLMGKAKAWQADLEWLVRPRNFLKVIEGKYENRDSSARETFLARFEGRIEDAT
jgi:phage replication O-like protein O